MRPLLVLALLGAALLAASTEAVAVGLDACVGRQCLSFHPLPTLLTDLPAVSFETPFGRVVIVPCV